MRILFLTWRDTRNPEGGGSEVYVENVASALAAAGHEVTIFCASYPDAAPLEIIDGVRFVRRGTKLGVHLEAVRYLRSPTFGTPDVTDRYDPGSDGHWNRGSAPGSIGNASTLP